MKYLYNQYCYIKDKFYCYDHKKKCCKSMLLHYQKNVLILKIKLVYCSLFVNRTILDYPCTIGHIYLHANCAVDSWQIIYTKYRINIYDRNKQKKKNIEKRHL